MNIPCCNKIVCDGVDNSNLDFDSPLANLTSELPDRDLFIGLNWGWDSNVPPLGSNFAATSCLGLCTSPFSQDDADACAARNQLICASTTWGPPGTTPNGGPTHGPPLVPPPSTPQGLPTNQSQTCTVLCPDGTPFSWTVAGGYMIASNVALANEMAYSLACRFAFANMICLGALSTSRACVNSNFSATVAFTGGLAPFTTSIISGSLPPGLSPADGSDARSFLVFGTPTTAGDYTFTLRATDSRGNYMQKTFTIHILGITTAAALPNAFYQQAYSQQLSSTGGTAPYIYTIAGSPAPLPPDGITVSPTGLISGTPTVAGDFQFVAIVTDANGISCQKGMTLHVNAVCNSATSGTASCPGDPSKTTTQSVAAGTFCQPVGGNQTLVDIQANNALFNQIAAALTAQGCACTVTVTGTPGFSTNANNPSPGNQILHFTCPTTVLLTDQNGNLFPAPLNVPLVLNGNVNIQPDLWCLVYGCPLYPVGLIRVNTPFGQILIHY